MKVGFFGGSFDPIHLGHLNLAIRILEAQQLDRVLFCPALVSPTKILHPPQAAAYHRLNMVRMSLEGVPGCVPYEAELSRPPPSYTIDSVRQLEAAQCFLILAEDAAYGLDQWKDVEELLSLARPLIGTRSGGDQTKLERLRPSIRQHVTDGLCSIPLMDVSSSEIRDRLKKGLCCAHLLPAKVLDYIHQNGLYCGN